MNYAIRERLDYYYDTVNAIILSKQNPVTGLIPASVAVTTHGDYRDAWVRDNVYSILAVFGLALAYRRIDDDRGKAYELKHAVIKLMRGLLQCMMKQAHKVEQFKEFQSPGNCLHAKYNTANCEPVVSDHGWGHLQLDATSLYLLALVEMTQAGFQIIYTQDEVDFIQNLVYYLERSYRTPDYGIWERGNKINHGTPELNASSIGMVVAALDAIRGVNLFGSDGGPSSIIQVLPDEFARNYGILNSMLPRESNSKEVDAALLSVIGYPAFALDDIDLVNKTRKEIVQKLGGNYGFKRFLRDGHQTVLEDTTRLHYEANELKVFENIECEWPLFFTYLILEGHFNGDMEQVELYRRKLRNVKVESTMIEHVMLEGDARKKMDHDKKKDGSENKSSSDSSLVSIHEPTAFLLIPELYIVPKNLISLEKENPGSQPRIPNENVPLVWAQSLSILGDLMSENLLSPEELDPTGRRLNIDSNRKRKVHGDVVIQVALLAESPELRDSLAMFGLETQTVDEINPIRVLHPSALKEAFSFLGHNRKLGLTGRPQRPIGTLSTSKIYKFAGHLYAVFPNFMDQEQFYLTSDNDYLISVIEQEVSYIRNNWIYNGRPTLVLLLTKARMGGFLNSDALENQSQRNGLDCENLFSLLASLRSGTCNGVKVRLCRLGECINTSCIESLDFLQGHGDHSKMDIPKASLSSFKHTFRVKKMKKKLKSSQDATKAKRMASVFIDSELMNPLSSPVVVKNFIKELSMDQEVEPLNEDSKTRIRTESYKLKHDHKAENTTTLKKKIHQLQSNSEAGSESETEQVHYIEFDVNNTTVSLTPDDPKSISMAITLLMSTSNIYDQIDLLHFLVLAKGLQFVIKEYSCEVRELLNEIYRKSVTMKLWDVTRRAAGLLKKAVNSLTINVADIVIRLKHITIGSAKREFAIHEPMGPSLLSDKIYEYCNQDVREAPFVQELLTFLGQLIRGDPSLFNGILRLRTHYLIISMREEISYSRGCNSEEALDLLMQMKPNEVQALLKSVYSFSDLCTIKYKGLETHGEQYHTTLNRKIRDTGFQKNAIEEGKHLLRITVTAQSAGFHAGNSAIIRFNNFSVTGTGMGLNVITMNPHNGLVLDMVTFNTERQSGMKRFCKFMDSLRHGTIVIICSKGSCIAKMDQSSGKLGAVLSSIGSRYGNRIKDRDSWCIIGEKGSHIGSVPETHREPFNGPTDIIEKTFEILLTDKEESEFEFICKPTITDLLSGPCAGSWKRRRRIDGAINRVPENFYPRVWVVLDKFKGIRTQNGYLPREPTVAEKTPEEFNFALAVEKVLDGIIEPCDRYLTVEGLLSVHKLIEKHNELFPEEDGTLFANMELDMKDLIDKSVLKCWIAYENERRAHQKRVSEVGYSQIVPSPGNDEIEHANNENLEVINTEMKKEPCSSIAHKQKVSDYDKCFQESSPLENNPPKDKMCNEISVQEKPVVNKELQDTPLLHAAKNITHEMTDRNFITGSFSQKAQVIFDENIDRSLETKNGSIPSEGLNNLITKLNLETTIEETRVNEMSHSKASKIDTSVDKEEKSKEKMSRMEGNVEKSNLSDTVVMNSLKDENSSGAESKEKITCTISNENPRDMENNLRKVSASAKDTESLGSDPLKPSDSAGLVEKAEVAPKDMVNKKDLDSKDGLLSLEKKPRDTSISVDTPVKLDEHKKEEARSIFVDLPHEGVLSTTYFFFLSALEILPFSAFAQEALTNLVLSQDLRV